MWPVVSGADYVRKVQVLYCDLCEMYLPRREQMEAALTSHCRTRVHLQRYVRHRDDVHLRREAERIHRRDKAEQEARNKALKEVSWPESYGAVCFKPSVCVECRATHS